MGEYVNKNSGSDTQRSLRGDAVKTFSRSGAFQFKDNRPQEEARRSLQDQIAQSPITKAAAQFKASMNAQSVTQLTTKITHHTAPFNVGGFNKPLILGESMEAYLDPNDPVKGTEPGGDGEEKRLNMSVCKMEKGQTLERAHLLNHDLGGFGINENLYPMTAIANRQHEREVESIVKQRLYGNKKRHHVHYIVRVDTGDRSIKGLKEGTTFECEIHSVDASGKGVGDKNFPSVIKSIPSKISENPKKTDANQKPWKGKDPNGNDWSFGQYTAPPKEWSHGNNVLNEMGWSVPERSGKMEESDNPFSSYLGSKIFVPSGEEKHKTDHIASPSFGGGGMFSGKGSGMGMTMGQFGSGNTVSSSIGSTSMYGSGIAFPYNLNMNHYGYQPMMSEEDGNAYGEYLEERDDDEQQKVLEVMRRTRANSGKPSSEIASIETGVGEERILEIWKYRGKADDSDDDS